MAVHVPLNWLKLEQKAVFCLVKSEENKPFKALKVKKTLKPRHRCVKLLIFVVFFNNMCIFVPSFNSFEIKNRRKQKLLVPGQKW